MSEFLESVKKQKKNILYVGIIVSIVMFGVLLVGYNNFSDVKTVYLRMQTVEEGELNINVTRVDLIVYRTSSSELNNITQYTDYSITFDFETEKGSSDFLEWNIIGLFIDFKIIMPKIYDEFILTVTDNDDNTYSTTVSDPYRLSTIILETVSLPDSLNVTVFEINPFLEFLKYI